MIDEIFKKINQRKHPSVTGDLKYNVMRNQWDKKKLQGFVDVSCFRPQL